MKNFNKIAFLTLLFALPSLVNAQISAITETGDEVILYSDNTWKYVDENVESSKEIPTNDGKFEKDKNSNFLVKSKKIDVGVYLNPKKWSFTKQASNEAAEFEFTLKGEDLYAMMVTEKLEIPLLSLKEIAIENARSAAPDLKIIKEEYRIVNGLKVLMLQMNGTIQGMKFTYYGYYYSSPKGSVQFISYTGTSLLNNYLEEIHKLINGLVVIE